MGFISALGNQTLPAEWLVDDPIRPDTLGPPVAAAANQCQQPASVGGNSLIPSVLVMAHFVREHCPIATLDPLTFGQKATLLG